MGHGATIVKAETDPGALPILEKGSSKDTSRGPKVDPRAVAEGELTGRGPETPGNDLSSLLPVKPKRKRGRGKPADKLTPRQEAFVKAYTNPGAKTFGNKLQSAKGVGYSENSAYKIIESSGVRNAIEEELRAVNADSKVRVGVIANLLHEKRNVTEQYTVVDGIERLVSRTVTDNGKMQLAAARELARLDGSYHRAALISHGQRKVLDTALEAWSKRLRASLAPVDPPTTDTVLERSGEATVDASMVDGESMASGQTEGTEGQDASVGGQGDGQTGGEGVRGGSCSLM